MKKWMMLLLGLMLLAGGLGAARSEEAEDLTAACRFRLSYGGTSAGRITDGRYTTYWEDKRSRQPFLILDSETPIHGLYLCFRTVPEHYAVQVTAQEDAARTREEIAWETVAEGDADLAHAFFPLEGVRGVRVLATAEESGAMGFNEVFAFGAGELPDWVQRWEPTEEKADILFLTTHPDDELLFFGGAIPTYAAERGKRVLVAYLTYSNATRRSEALNGLWHMGVRHYPVFGTFRDVYSRTAQDAYGKIRGKEDAVHAWLTEILRRYRPEVVVTQDLEGEYGHGQHKMVADSALACFDLAAEAEAFPDSAARYGTWQVRKLYLHLFGEEAERTRFDWEVPLTRMGGKTGTELAEEAFALHVTQKGSGMKLRGRRYTFSVRHTGGELFPNTSFGLARTVVGPDETHLDFLEHIDTEE